jgi:Xaa-Pro dipeptidase
MFANPFSEAELAGRHGAVRDGLTRRKLAGAVFAAPENVFWLTGLDHWGYFAPHLLVFPIDGVPVLVTRAMERVSVETHVRAARFRGHGDAETAADAAAQVVAELKLEGQALGLESWSSGLSLGLGSRLKSRARAKWRDVSGLVDGLRLVKSPAEQALMRKAARVSDEAFAAALAAIGDGAREADVAAECLAAMTRAGGQPPGFGPFIRPARRLGEEHGTWGNGHFRAGEPVFLELSGCVSRYHAPLGRLVRIGDLADDDARMSAIAQQAFAAVVAALRPGRKASEVYGAWQGVVDAAGLAHYRRHHCGYAVGVGVPPSWTGGNTVVGLRADSDLEIRDGMSFHVLSWLMGAASGNDFVSSTVLVTATGAEILNQTPLGPFIR